VLVFVFEQAVGYHLRPWCSLGESEGVLVAWQSVLEFVLGQAVGSQRSSCLNRIRVRKSYHLWSWSDLIEGEGVLVAWQSVLVFVLGQTAGSQRSSCRHRIRVQEGCPWEGEQVAW